MQKKTLKKETDALHQIAQASEAIRRKHNLIKLGKENVNRAMSEALKPVVTPLEKLITHTELEQKRNKKEMMMMVKKKSGRRRRKEWSPPPAFEDPYKTAYEDDDDDEYMALPSALNLSRIDDTLPLYSPKTSSPRTFEKSANAQHLESLYDNDNDDDAAQRLLHQYLERLNTNGSSLDVKYGVRKLASGMQIGDTAVRFDNKIMKLGNQQYTLTSGLIELIFKKSPNMSLVTQTDEQNYGTILRNTNAARKYYVANNSLRSDPKFPKYVNIIKNLVRSSDGEEKEEEEEEEEVKTGSALPRYMMAARERAPTDYIYWDDPNELVERLRLLMASKSAGNPSHSNEIVSIIEELREAQIIY